jgi:hypothetical protein
VRHISPVPGNEKKMVSKFIDTPGFKLPGSESSMESMDFERNEHMVDFAAAELENQVSISFSLDRRIGWEIAAFPRC